MPDVGDHVTLSLTVDPAGPDTLAALTVTAPDGAITHPVVSPSTDRTRWAADVLLNAAGEWRALWQVTGTGAGTQADTVWAIGEPLGRVYATPTQLAAYLGEQPAPDARRVLVRATRVVDDALLTALYDVDEQAMPTDPRVAAALAEATCAQVEWWAEIGDATGTGAVSALAGAQIGTVKLPGGGGGAGSGGIPDVAPAALAALRRANLTGRGPEVYDRLAGGLLGNPARTRP